MNFIDRKIVPYLIESSKKYPVVTLTGPRQSGKTTLVKNTFQNKPYVNFELPFNREYAEEDPIGFLKEYEEGAIFDEIQRVPKILSYIQAIVDEKDEVGQFVLTGSHQFGLLESINQSLAGRTAILKLLPFSYLELNSSVPEKSILNLLYEGFYPRVHQKQINPTQAYGDYYETYVERDVRQISNIKDLKLFQKFIQVLASRVSQLINYQSIANEIGVSQVTIKEWMSILEASFLIYTLSPFHKNITKRLVKTPKLYFYDVGLVSFLLGIEEESQLKFHPLKGELFENLVVTEFLKFRFHSGKRNNLLFYRDSNGSEVDLLYKQANKFNPIEIKSAETIHKSFSKGIHSFEKVEPEINKRIVVYAGEQRQFRNEIYYFPFLQFRELIKEVETTWTN